jgi:hypothetical protein
VLKAKDPFLNAQFYANDLAYFSTPNTTFAISVRQFHLEICSGSVITPTIIVDGVLYNCPAGLCPSAPSFVNSQCSNVVSSVCLYHHVYDADLTGECQSDIHPK